MKYYAKQSIAALFLLLTLTSCGSNSVSPPPPGTITFGPGGTDRIPPTIVSVNPLNGATNVGVGNIISATFSEPISISTLSTNVTFIVTIGGTLVPGSVSLPGGTTAIFTPSAPLLGNTQYNIVVTTGITDLAGNAMVSNYSWSFTTTTAPDLTPPFVIAVTPASGATNVSIDTSISAVFSELLNAATVTANTFFVSGVTGSVLYSSVTATFTPALALASNTTYTATLTTGIKDLAGNTLSVDKVWSFTTAPTPTITTAALPAATETGTYSQALAFTGGVGPYAWIATGLPAGLSINAATGVISGAPNSGTAGASPYSVTVTVTDSEALSASQIFSLTVNPVPSITTPGSVPAATETGAYTLPLIATGGTGTMTWNAVGLPAGLSINPATGVISGAPNSGTAGASPYSASVTVTDANLVTSAALPLSITVNAAPTITTSSPIGAWTQGATATITFAAINGTGTLTWSSTTAPTLAVAAPWLTLNSPASGDLTGTAPMVTATYTFNITVTDSNGVSTTSLFSVVVP